MATSKIKKILTEGKWHEKSQTWYYDLEMENGDKGSKGVKKQGALSVGQELTYTLEDDGRGGKRIKTAQQSSSPANNSPDYQNGVAVGHALNNAVLLICAGKVELKDLRPTADNILQHAIEMKDILNSK